jgi:hypothetical protein
LFFSRVPAFLSCFFGSPKADQFVHKRQKDGEDHGDLPGMGVVRLDRSDDGAVGSNRGGFAQRYMPNNFKGKRKGDRAKKGIESDVAKADGKLQHAAGKKAGEKTQHQAGYGAKGESGPKRERLIGHGAYSTGRCLEGLAKRAEVTEINQASYLTFPPLDNSRSLLQNLP